MSQSPPDGANIMSDKAYPIALEKLFFTRSIVIAVPEYQPTTEAVTLGPINTIDVKPLDGVGEGRYIASMRSLLNQNSEATAPYLIDMECVGIFVVDGTLSLEEAHRGVTITAHNVLFGAIREAVAWLTGRQPHGSLLLGLSILKNPSQAIDPAIQKTPRQPS